MITAHVCHHAGSRLRLKFSGLADDRHLLDLVDQLSEHESVETIKLNTKTGSVVIWLKGSIQDVREKLLDQLACQLQDETAVSRPSVGQQVFKGFKGLNRVLDLLIRRLSSNSVDLVTVFAALLLWGVFKQWRSKSFLPAGLSILLLIHKQMQSEPEIL